MNKIWNASRFCLSHLEDRSFEHREEINPSQLLTADKWLIYQLGLVEKEVNDFLENMRFSDAANRIYSFTWHEFCDWYLEFSKPVLYGNDKKQKRITQWVLIESLNRIIRLLHPFIPFITEEIYNKLPNHGGLCIEDRYPTPRRDEKWLCLGSKPASFEMELVKQVIVSIRNIRGENNIKPSEKMEAWLSPGDDHSQKLLVKNKSEIIRLASLKACEIKKRESLKKCAVTPVRMGQVEIDVIVPLEGFVDIEKEIQRLKKLIEKQEKEMQKIKSKLDNKNFMAKAPKEVIENNQKLLREMNLKTEEMKKSLLRLSED